MRYQGGKSRIAKDIAKIINQARFSRYGNEGGCVVSLFCGTCSVESKLQGFDRRILNDRHEYLIAMLRAVQQGYELPDEVSEAQYRYLREHKDEDKALAGFVGFGCSFGGKFFNSFARGGREIENYAAESKKSLLRDMQTLTDAEFINHDYRDVEIPDGAIVYADPPYSGTTAYFSNEKFNTKEFWQYARDLTERGHLLFVSELVAPDDFVCVWQKELMRQLDSNKNNLFKSTEKLFVHRGFANEL